MERVSPYVSIITLNVNELLFPIKRHRMVGWIKKQDATICCLQESHFNLKDTNEEMENIFHTTGNQQRDGLAIFMSDKKDCMPKTITREKRSTPHEDLTIVNICPLKTATPKYIKQILTDLKEEIR